MAARLKKWDAWAEEIAAAHDDGNTAAFQGSLEAASGDVWRLADHLLRRNHPDAALAFALARPGPETARLPAYLEGRRARGFNEELRQLVDVALVATTDEEREVLLTALDKLAGQGDGFERALAERRRGSLLRGLGRPAEAASAYMSGAGEAERLGWLVTAAWMFNACAFAANDVMDSESMLLAFGKLALIQQGRGLHSSAGEALMNLGSTHATLGDYASADRYYDDAEKAYERAKTPVNIAWLLNNRSDSYLTQGRYAEAQVALDRACMLIDRKKEPLLFAQLDLSLGTLAYTLRQFDRAADLYEQAQDVFVELKAEDYLAGVIGNLALVQIERKEFAAAHEYLDRALSIHRRLGEDEAVSTVLTNKAWALMEEGAYEKAKQALEKSLALARKVKSLPAEAHALENLAQLRRRMGDGKEALRLHKEVVRIGSRLQSHLFQLLGHRGIAEDWLSLGRPDQASRAAERAMAHSLPLISGLGGGQAADARKQLIQLYRVAIDAAVAWKNPAALLRAMEGARAGALLEALENRHAIRTAQIPAGLQQKERDARRALRVAVMRYHQALRAGVLRGIRRQARVLEEARSSLHTVVSEIQRAAKAAASVLYPVAATLEEAQAALEVGEALVSYSMLGEEAVALVLTRATARIVRLGAIQALREAAEAHFDDPDVQVGAALGTLRTLLVTQLALKKSEQKILISPDGILGYVPFSALLGSRVVSYVPSATAYRTLQGVAVVRGRGVLALGDPAYQTKAAGRPGSLRGAEATWPRLPATRKEAVDIGDVVLLGKQATRSGLLAALAKRPHWRAVHLACHGAVDSEHPMRSALALAAEEDGSNLFTCLDVVRSQIPTDLAVLSACNTGRGKVYKVEGIVGLTQAFMLAGAPRVIVSLWRVDDAATQVLMLKFYELWNREKDGLSPRDALAAAQAHVRSQPRWKHPYYWAAWALWGEPN